MSDIKLVRPHSLPLTKAKALAQKTADALAAEYDLTSEWRGNTLRVLVPVSTGRCAVRMRRSS